MSDLRKKTIISTFWSYLESFSIKSASLITTFVLAWLLIPEDFAPIAMIAVYLQLSNFLIESGFKNALIRQEKVTETQYSSIFIFNFFMSVAMYCILFFLAPLLADFYDEPILTSVLRVALISIFFNGLTLCSIVALSRELNFKDQLKAIFPSTVLSAIIACIMAYNGYGVWSIVCQIVSNSIFNAFFIYIIRPYFPKKAFNLDSIKQLFDYTSYIVFDRLINIPFKNMYLVALPKYFSLDLVGLYYFSEKLRDSIINLTLSALKKSTFPALAKVKKDQKTLIKAFRDLIKISTFLYFPILIFLIYFSEIIFVELLPTKWLGASHYFQILCLAILFMPINEFCLQSVLVRGRSKTFFYIGLLRRAVAVIIFLSTVQKGIEAILYGQLIASLINLVINIHFTKSILGYSFIKCLFDILPNLMVAFMSLLLLHILGSLLNFQGLVSLILCAFAYFGIYLFSSLSLKLPSLLKLKAYISSIK